MTTLAQRSTASTGDGLGYRVLGFDKQTGDRLDMLRVRPQFCGHVPFETTLRARLRHLEAFDDPAFARVRKIDSVPGPSPSLVIVSHHVYGIRLADVLSVAESFDVRIDIGAALGLVRQVAAALGRLHAAADEVSHGCIGPERLLLTADGRVIVTEYVLGSALEAMQWPREKFWHESRIALPAAGDPAVFDQRADILQLGLLALALVDSRAVYAERTYPLPLAQHVAAAREWPIEGASRRASPALTEWLARALQRDRLSAFATIGETLGALDQVIDEGRHDAQTAAVAAFVERCRRVSPDFKPRDGDITRPMQAFPSPGGRPSLPAGARADLPIRGDGASIEFVAAGDDSAEPAAGHAEAPPPAIARTIAAPEPEPESASEAEAAPRSVPQPVPQSVPESAIESALGEMNSLLDMEVLVGMLRQPRAPFVVHVDHHPLLLVDPAPRAYRLMAAPWSATPDGTPPEPLQIGELVARLRRGSLRYRDAAAGDYAAPGPGFPIDQLLWNLGMVLHPIDLLPQTRARGWVQLARWPDFTHIRSNHAQLKMSALFVSRAFNVDEVFEAVGEPRPSVIAFLNACALCGLLAETPIAVHSPSLAHLAPEGRPLGGLMQRLRGALGIGKS